MSNADFKCMLLLSKDQYEGLKYSSHDPNDADVSKNGNTVESGVGGDINDSKVHNIDVSNGGTLVINDADRPNSCTKGANSSPSKESTRTSPPNVNPVSSVPIVIQGPATSAGNTSGETFQSTVSKASSLPAKVKQRGSSSTSSVRIEDPVNASLSKPSSKQMLSDIVNKRVADLTGTHLPPKRRKHTMSDGDLNRAVIHDLRVATKKQYSTPHRPTLKERQLERYRGQIAKITPYKNPTPSSIAAPTKPSTPSARSSVSEEVQPHNVPLPPSSDDDSDVDEQYPNSSARVRPYLVTRRPPAAFSRRGKVTKRDRSKMSRGPLDPFYYEPRAKIQNTKDAAVRATGSIAGRKRGAAKTEDEKLWEQKSFPNKRMLYTRQISSDGDDI